MQHVDCGQAFGLLHCNDARSANLIALTAVYELVLTSIATDKDEHPEDGVQDAQHHCSTTDADELTLHSYMQHVHCGHAAALLQLKLY
jgi:hypothetical protein